MLTDNRQAIEINAGRNVLRIIGFVKLGLSVRYSVFDKLQFVGQAEPKPNLHRKARVR